MCSKMYMNENDPYHPKLEMFILIKISIRICSVEWIKLGKFMLSYQRNYMYLKKKLNSLVYVAHGLESLMRTRGAYKLFMFKTFFDFLLMFFICN